MVRKTSCKRKAQHGALTLFFHYKVGAAGRALRDRNDARRGWIKDQLESFFYSVSSGMIFTLVLGRSTPILLRRRFDIARICRGSASHHSGFILLRGSKSTGFGSPLTHLREMAHRLKMQLLQIGQTKSPARGP